MRPAQRSEEPSRFSYPFDMFLYSKIYIFFKTKVPSKHGFQQTWRRCGNRRSQGRMSEETSIRDKAKLALNAILQNIQVLNTWILRSTKTVQRSPLLFPLWKGCPWGPYNRSMEGHSVVSQCGCTLPFCSMGPQAHLTHPFCSDFWLTHPSCKNCKRHEIGSTIVKITIRCQ